ncbi:unnamed protein product [Penicillium camemberti]|uniref:Str. FM013 n=1 Tax=Penicillium camemberti (strain FM 013) TaxID=1429867 RepID=A0A0G4PIK6_PENC3|nr:unnamed protein product [Penicillium camemberti]
MGLYFWIERVVETVASRVDAVTATWWLSNDPIDSANHHLPAP